MIYTLAHRIASSIKRAAPDHPASLEVLRYTLASILNAVFIIILSLTIALLTGKFVNALVVLVAFALLRQVSGGIHLKDGTLCVLVTTAGVTAVSYVQFGRPLVIGMTIAALILAVIFAPSRIERQTRIPAKFHPLLKLIAVLMISTNFILLSAVLATTFLIQSLTLIRSLKGGEKG